MKRHDIKRDGTSLHVRCDGSGPSLVFFHHLGGDTRVWDGVVARLPDYQCIRLDSRGHGQSDAPEGPYTMGGLVKDAEYVLDELEVTDAVAVGLSLGGMIAQGLTVKRLDQVRGLVICASAAKFGQKEPWQDRAKLVRKDGMTAIATDTMERWNLGEESDYAEPTLLDTSPVGYAATCEAIAGTDFYTPTAGLRLPALGLCGDKDKSTPPDLVRETTDLIPGSTFELIKGAGHLAPHTHCEEVAARIQRFLSDIGHV